MPKKPSFLDDQVNFPLLRQRAYNLRWAEVPEDTMVLTAADPDFPAAPEIREAIQDYCEGGLFSYGPAEGLPELRLAASQHLSSKKGLTCSPSQILPTNSAAFAMFLVGKFALKPGDEAIVFDPVDFLFKKSVTAAGGKAVLCPLDPETGAFEPEQLRALVTPRTRLISICNPHNPLGKVLSRQELQFIGELAIEHQLWILDDCIWSDIVYTPHVHSCIGSLSAEIAARTFSVFGFSKNFALAGLRVGLLLSPSAAVHESILELSQVRTTAYGLSTLSQVAAHAALKHAWYWVEAFLEHLQEMRDYAWQRLNTMAGVHCRKPEGTYLLFPNVSAYGLASEAMAQHILEVGKVAVVPGAAKWFGPGAEGHLRICFSSSKGVLQEGLDRFEMALGKL